MDVGSEAKERKPLDGHVWEFRLLAAEVSKYLLEEEGSAMLESSLLAGGCLFLFPAKQSMLTKMFNLLAKLFGAIGCFVVKARSDFLRMCPLSSVTV